MPKHTPGPWEVRGDSPSDLHLVSAEGWIVCDPFGVNPQDARLIAAAPDLLVALEEIAASSGISGASIWVRNVARAAIAKAKGVDSVQ